MRLRRPTPSRSRSASSRGIADRSASSSKVDPASSGTPQPGRGSGDPRSGDVTTHHHRRSDSRRAMAAAAHRRASGAQSHQSSMARARKSDQRSAERVTSTTPSRAISNRSRGGAVSSEIRSTSRPARRARATARAGRREVDTPLTPMSRSLRRVGVPRAADPKTTASCTSGSPSSADLTSANISTGRFYPVGGGASRPRALAGIRDRHPEASPREQRLRLALITLGPELAVKAFPSPSP